MAFHYSPNIITDGLVLYLDAANTKSYVSGSTIWNDLSRGGNNGVLTNGPTFNSSNGGSIVFDGVDDYITNIGTTSSFSFIQNTAIATLSFWVKFNSTSNLEYIAGNTPTSAEKGFFLGKNANGSLQVAVTNGNGNPNSLVNYISPIGLVNDTNWHNYTITIDKSINTNTIYKDGVVFSSGTGTGAWTLASGNSTRTLVLAAINNFFTLFFNGTISGAKIYNKALSVSEVLQNYNATKGRYL